MSSRFRRFSRGLSRGTSEPRDKNPFLVGVLYYPRDNVALAARAWARLISVIAGNKDRRDATRIRAVARAHVAFILRFG